MFGRTSAEEEVLLLRYGYHAWEDGIWLLKIEQLKNELFSLARTFENTTRDSRDYVLYQANVIILGMDAASMYEPRNNSPPTDI